MDCLRKTLLVLAGLSLVCAGTTAFVLAAVGSLEVTVYEVDAKTKEQTLLDGASVIVTSVDGNVQRGGTTIGGQVTFAGLPEGDYKVEVKMATYGGRIVDARVLPNRVNQLAVGLTPERTTEVTVTATEDVVQLETGGKTSTKISEDFFEDLPVLGREYQSVLTLAPGVDDDDGDGNPNVHGARDRDFKMTVDGVSNVDPLTGRFQSFVNADAIEEIEVVDSGADASFGGASGFGKIITKTGGNEFEGTFNLFVRDSTFDNDLWGERDPQDFGLIRPSIFLSGPIVKDHLWFVVNHEYIDFKDPIDLVGGGSFVQKTTSFRSLDKVTWQVTPKNKLSFQYSADPQKIDPAGVSSTAPPETGVLLEFGGPVYTAKWTAPFSPTFFWEATLAYSDIKTEYHPVDRTVQNTCTNPGFAADEPLIHLMCFDTDQGRTRSGVFSQDFTDYRRRWTYQLDAEQYVQEWLGGSHRLKIGAGLENTHYDREKLQRNFIEVSSIQDVNLIIPTGEGGLTAAPDQQRRALTLFSPDYGGEDLRTNGAQGKFYHAYISDTYEPLPNLSITAGVRYSREEMTSPGWVPFDPRAEREAWAGYLDRCEEYMSGIFGRAVPPAACWARFIQGAAFVPPPTLSGFPIGTGFTFHEFDLPEEFGGSCSNPRQCGWLSQAGSGGIERGLDLSRQRQGETFDIINNNLDPRFSIAWDPNNDGKTKLSFNWGRYHNQSFLSPLVDEADSDFTQVFQTVDAQGQLTSDSSGLDGAWQIRAIDRNLRSARMDQWGVLVEREIAPETSLRVRYLHQQFRDQLQDVDVNHSPVLWNESIHGPIECAEGQPQKGCCVRIGKFADCTGKEALESGGTTPRVVALPDGIADLELQSPFFNNVYLVGNFNSSDYEAYILELVRRYYQNWELQASYTWSKAIGQAEDYNTSLGDDPSNVEDEVGFLNYDHRHTVKINGRVMLPYWGGIRIGGVFSYQTGRPYSVVVVRNVRDAATNLAQGATQDWSFAGKLDMASSTARTIFPTGRRNDQRNSPFWDFNLNLQKDFDIRNIRATAQLDIFNVLNDDSIILRRLIKVESALRTGGTEDRFVPDGFRRQGRIFQAMLKLNF